MGLEDTSGVGETGRQHASQAGLQLQGLRECWLEGLGPQEGPGPHWGSCSRAGTRGCSRRNIPRPAAFSVTAEQNLLDPSHGFSRFAVT